MDVKANNFVATAQIALKDPQLQATLAVCTRNGLQGRTAGVFEFGREHGEALRRQAAEAKRQALRNLPELLEQAEARMQANGMHVLWAADAAEARQHVIDLVKQHGARFITKSKSTLTEEINLNPALAKIGVEVLETDLGAYIVQLAGEAPSHIVGPALHMSKDEICDPFVRELQMPVTESRRRDDAVHTRAFAPGVPASRPGICGGNFIVAETGSLCLSAQRRQWAYGDHASARACGHCGD